MPTNASAAAEGINVVGASTSFTVKSLTFKDGKGISDLAEKSFRKEEPIAGVAVRPANPGLKYAYYEGVWGALPDFSHLKPVDQGITQNIDLTMKKRNTDFGLCLKGYLKVPEDGVYQFYLSSNDGSKMILSGKTLSNDGLHGMEGKSMDIALKKGIHPIEIQYFQAGGGNGLKLEWKSMGMERTVVDSSCLLH